MSDAKNKSRRDNTDPESTRREILQAALEILSRDGPESLNVSEVARRARVNRGTAYQHFPTREDLVHATAAWVSERMYDEFYREFDAAADRDEVYPPEQALQRLTEFAMNNPELSRAWLFDVMATEGPVTDRFWRRYVDALSDYVERGLGRADMDIEVFAFITLASALLWPVWAGAHAKGSRAQERMRQRFYDEMLRLSAFGSLVPEHHLDLRQRLRQGEKPS